MTTPDKAKRFYSKPALAERYETTTRSIDRWITSGRFPPPDLRLPSGQGRWSETTIEAHERSPSLLWAASTKGPGKRVVLMTTE